MKPEVSTKSCQIAVALRPRDKPRSMVSRKGALAQVDRLWLGCAPRTLNSTPKSVITSLFYRRGVGNHSVGRFWRRPAPASARAHRNSGGLKVCPNRLASDVHGSFDAPQRPFQTPQSYYLLSLFLSQEVAHIDGGYGPRVGFNVPSDGLSLAGFQVIMYGWFWVVTEAIPRSSNSRVDDNHLAVQ